MIALNKLLVGNLKSKERRPCNQEEYEYASQKYCLNVYERNIVIRKNPATRAGCKTLGGVYM